MKKSVLILAFLALSCKAYAFPDVKAHPHEVVTLTSGKKVYSQTEFMFFHEVSNKDISLYRCYDDRSFGYDVLVTKTQNMMESMCFLCNDTEVLERSSSVNYIKSNGIEAYIYYFENGRMFLFADGKAGWFQADILN